MSETKKRSFVKIITWHIIALAVTFGVSYFYTGLVIASVKITLTGIFVGMIFFYFHERIWDKIKWGKLND